MKSANLLTIVSFIVLTAMISAGQNKTESINKGDTIEQTIIIAQNLLKKGDAAGAISILQAASQSNPQNEIIKYWLGKAFYSQGNYQKAIENLNLAVDKFPKNTAEQIQSVQMLGLAHYISGQLAEAIPYFEKITQWQPENSEVAYALGVSYIQTRQPAKSRDVFAKLFKVPTNSAAA
ncbi:MAG: tetratricopeptide repeat protein, partial [Acidobacteriota bacterium]|nr:tetratricopeptide repeat protein [Acidobacteriota bacterium]